MQLSDLVQEDVKTIREDAEVTEIAARMAQWAVGSLVVLDDQGRPTGIVTDRDLVVRSIACAPAARRDAAVRNVMSKPLITGSPSDTLAVAAKIMRSSGIRRLPVCDGEGEMVGIVTLDDILNALACSIHDLGEETFRKNRRAARTSRIENARSDLEEVLREMRLIASYTRWYARDSFLSELDLVKARIRKALDVLE